ncbi:hypothetical protein SPRG_02811 [Saprolegnia parasitica CBS 223.65]|uniref:Actin n=1 Tax=Saprolegnia parasitica (strain CBS 223.65) TaxID=695850 RepID=A0A067CZV6_SAPPC|nr:hypothetical protein SPRG_02811 [Saprolegnia parasitica CBS 223.65]KDO32332.1 hypothetical protein SPRG_02811 [Saprolegnia parasitica CBS 223.65]|eukprot:XP_012196788.1 hypothetical protein SPRG_02811 [Saprolegnia parasitica CBS 223.65]
MMNMEKHAIVLDVGSRYLKSGISGERSPRSVLRYDLAEKLLQTPPLSKAQWHDYMGGHLYRVCFHDLRVTPKSRRFVVCEDLLLPRNLREAIHDVLLLVFKAKHLLFVPATTTALYATSHVTALIVDVGWLETRVLPVFERMPILSAYKTTGLASQYACAGLKGYIPTRDTPVEDILERACFVLPASSEALVVEDAEFFAYTPKAVTLPAAARHECLEPLFTGTDELVSIPDAILDCLAKCPVDTRKALSENILCIGGTCMLPGFRARLQHELQAEHMSARVVATAFPPNLMTWVGASVYGSTSDAMAVSLSQSDYAAHPVVDDWMKIHEAP